MWSRDHNAKGIRFIFGYADDSVDSSRYGQYFGEEWDRGDILTYAFLNASWRISTGQTPIAVAFGANQTEAVNRRDTERYITAGSVGNNWAAWRWYYARSLAALPLAAIFSSFSGIIRVSSAFFLVSLIFFLCSLICIEFTSY